jgi:hypothetical protein
MEGIKRPYRRTARPFINGNYPWGRRTYIRHRRFAQDPTMYVRGFRLLQNDLERLFEYIEPGDDNLKCYSFRVYEMLLRACVEVEANCKAILRENDYPAKKQWTMHDYSKINSSHNLSSFEVKLPYWHGERMARSSHGITRITSRSMTVREGSRRPPLSPRSTLALQARTNRSRISLPSASLDSEQRSSLQWHTRRTTRSRTSLTPLVLYPRVTV